MALRPSGLSLASAVMSCHIAPAGLAWLLQTPPSGVPVFRFPSKRAPARAATRARSWPGRHWRSPPRPSPTTRLDRFKAATAQHSPVQARLLTRVPSSRSEEHTSELQSLMRISYAVFYLKKKKKDKYTLNQTTIQHTEYIHTLIEQTYTVHYIHH